MNDKYFLDDLMPTNTLMAAAWFGCLQWAISEPDLLDAYRADTGDTWSPGKSVIEKMIDDSTGANRAFIRSFAAWMTANVWGRE